MAALFRTSLVRDAGVRAEDADKHASSEVFTESSTNKKDEVINTTAVKPTEPAGQNSNKYNSEHTVEANTRIQDPEPSPVDQKVTEVDGYFIGNSGDGESLAKTNADVGSAAASPKIDEEEESLEWMVRNCGFYKAEYSDCWSFKAKFHDYFVEGQAKDCAVHQTNYKNCKMWKDNGDKEALEKLIQYERTKIRTRVRNHLRNDVWENRTEPPKDWNSPLPKEIEEEYEKSYLKYKKPFFQEDTRKAHGPDDVTLFQDDSFCAIM